MLLLDLLLVWGWFLVLFLSDPNLHSLKEEFIYLYMYTHTFMLCGFPSMDF